MNDEDLKEQAPVLAGGEGERASARDRVLATVELNPPRPLEGLPRGVCQSWTDPAQLAVSLSIQCYMRRVRPLRRVAGSARFAGAAYAVGGPVQRGDQGQRGEHPHHGGERAELQAGADAGRPDGAEQGHGGVLGACRASILDLASPVSYIVTKIR